MKKRLTLAAALAATIVMTGCMSEREYQLRKNDIEAKKEWKPTYQILSIKGPLNVPEGGELIINAPSQPFVHTNIPDGQAYQLRALTTTEASGTAHKIRFVRQGAQIYAFVDDVQEGVAEIAGTKALNFSTPGNKLIIGRNMIEHGSTQFYGKTYWVRIWNRAILDSIPEPSGTAVAQC